MPLIMDDDQYMDLFNEAEQLPIAVQTPPVKRLAQRLDELGESGCCQKISWSKSGCVASITRDGRGVNLRAFQRNPVDGKWILGDEAPLHIPSVHEEFPLVHVSWGHLGVDLAVVDAAGRILVYTAAQAADRMKLSREPFSDHESESNALVGLHWLPVAPQQVKYHMIWSADRNEDKWQYRMTSHPWKEPHNPVHPRMSLGAFICFTRGGTVRLLFQQPDQQWYEATAEVEASNSGKDAFTHASFTSDSAPNRHGTNALLPQETAKSVSGLLRWTMDLMVYMINDLIELSHECRKHEADRGFVQKKRRFLVASMAHALADSETRFVVQERRSPGLFLLLCSFPRSIFRLTRQPLQLLLTISQWHMKNAPTVIHRSVFNGLMAAMIGSPVHPPHMAALVLEVDNQVRMCYTRAQYTDERRRMAEREMLISAEIPDVLMPVVTRLLTHGIDKLLDTVDPAKVMYWDLRWLGLSEDKREKEYLEKNTVDVMRKVVVSRKEGVRRRCVRCGSEMEDMEWMGGQNKCACGSPWAMGSMTKKT
ncbi:Mediator of RNA polymerase II transcription subunit 16 [Diplodia seriata]